MFGKKRSKEDVKSKKTVSIGGMVTKSGRKQKSGVAVEFNDGTKTTLLTPAGKATKYAMELRDGKHYTNDFEVKKDKKDREKRLTDLERAYRAGYLDNQKDAHKAYNASQGQKDNRPN